MLKVKIRKYTEIDYIARKENKRNENLFFYFSEDKMVFLSFGFDFRSDYAHKLYFDLCQWNATVSNENETKRNSSTLIHQDSRDKIYLRLDLKQK